MEEDNFMSCENILLLIPFIATFIIGWAGCPKPVRGVMGTLGIRAVVGCGTARSRPLVLETPL